MEKSLIKIERYVKGIYPMGGLTSRERVVRHKIALDGTVQPERGTLQRGVSFSPREGCRGRSRRGCRGEEEYKRIPGNEQPL